MTGNKRYDELFAESISGLFEANMLVSVKKGGKYVTLQLAIIKDGTGFRKKKRSMNILLAPHFTEQLIRALQEGLTIKREVLEEMGYEEIKFDKDMTDSEIKIIRELEDHQKLHRSDIQKHTNLNPRTLANNLTKMLKAGKITKQPDLQDTRRVYYSLPSEVERK